MAQRPSPLVPTGLTPSRSRRAFTLIETCLATAIVGIGFTAMLQLMAAGTAQNAAGHRTTTAVGIAASVREHTVRVPFDTLVAMDGGPARDAGGAVIATPSEWSQQLQVVKVNPDDVAQTWAATADSGLARVTVLVRRNGDEVHRGAWLITKGL